LGGGGDCGDQRTVDRALIASDGTPDKSRIGANAILGASMAVARAAAVARGVPLYRHLASGPIDSLPVPMTNVINGGAHAANALDFEEFMLVPIGAPTIAEAVRMLAETFHALRSILEEAGHVTSVGDKGGYAPEVKQPARCERASRGQPVPLSKERPFCPEHVRDDRAACAARR